MKRSFYLFALLFIGFSANAQNWQYLRHEFGLSIGATNFLGELGGADKIGTDFLNDFEFSMTRPVVQIHYRYTINPNFHAKIRAGWAILSGDDALTQEQYRHNRNLHFKSNIWEAALHLEWYPFGEKLGHLYRMKGAKGKGYSYLSPYVFAGVGAFKFNPKARDQNGSWTELHPLNTEGQGMPGGADEYTLFQLNVPMGIGIRYSLSKQWSLGFEISRILTFTDYVDDVSTVYYDPVAIGNANGPTAVYLADPSLHELDNIAPYNDPTFFYQSPTDPGLQRGDASDNDAYMYALLSLNYKLLYGKFNLPKF